MHFSETQQNPSSPSIQPVKEELCPSHNRKLEIICIQDRQRICSNCALFGGHKGHDVRMEQEVVTEITLRTDLLIEMYQLVHETASNRVEPAQLQAMQAEFNSKSVSMKTVLAEKFKEIRQIINMQEQIATTILDTNLQCIEKELAKMKLVPASLFENAEVWSQSAKEKLDLFEANMDKPNFINYDMLEGQSAGPDIISEGENLIGELEQHKDISADRVLTQLAQLGLSFDQKLIKSLSGLVNC